MKKALLIVGCALMFMSPALADLPMCGSIDDTWLGACAPIAAEAKAQHTTEAKYIGQPVQTALPVPQLSVVKSLPVSSQAPSAVLAPTPSLIPVLPTKAPATPAATPVSSSFATPAPLATPVMDTSLVAYEIRKTKEKKLAYPVQSSPRTDISSLLERGDANDYSQFETLLQKEVGLAGIDTRGGFSRAKAVEAILITQNASLLTPLPKESIFPDVMASSPSSPFIKTLKSQMAIDGYDDGFFRSEKKINAAESYKMISIAFEMAEYTEEKKGNDWYIPFKDVIRKENVASEMLQKSDETLPSFPEFSQVLWNAATTD